ncbi:tRNA (adenosine(37)-N6)-dimethylallyltransferase MiaA [Candidatus Shapirobacteria bacterium RIFOXYC1_FULL_38_24]|uniref:tRNA dimethylallyltransferase n=2 Tax=Candidatus Shapironibacteriota TaxID=1752721 RepID=A0A0G0K7S1_9BACT|nr:MAG: tRNA dimethylallyltransferase [Candidatus Shapirobacteria bacterium GW2011_GWE2_38_30]OGL56026.1 MAG: tRNA (adenosine(37)-N6)-dimethylallyltransferase MiaA [Candidatus Shapirobacteria bacterium RIFOXYC1_FULL_38_24]HAP37813.1 tRNA (adenosine(37)-N6)-dimethylallyltransferase MiaA [Candidatus Shapirobacteria bacterium]
MSPNKLLIISGPTATGKTSLAIKLAKKFNGQLISADSRQIYRGLDIGTGKDHPKDTNIHLIDLIDPNQSFSAAQYRLAALELIQKTWQSQQLPIIVGGSGQYIDAIINPKSTFSIKPNRLLRNILNHLPVKFLQYLLKLIDNETYNSLNNSDINNPHRLIRKIEVKLTFKNTNNLPLVKGGSGGIDFLHISLTAPTSYLYQNIDKRVKKRIDLGLINEIKSLLKKYKWSDPGLNTLAYKEFKNYFKNPNPDSFQLSKEKWRFHEHSYARRQITWFKKIPKINIIDITQKDYDKVIVDLVTNWIYPK